MSKVHVDFSRPHMQCDMCGGTGSQAGEVCGNCQGIGYIQLGEDAERKDEECYWALERK